MTPENAYAELVRLSREESVLSSCVDLLDWDQEIYMPRDGVEHRSEQTALLAGIVHDRATNPRYGELLDALEGSALLSDPESAESVNVRELRRGYDRERRIPKRLVEELARATSRASKVWAEARKEDDFKSFAPWLDKVFALSREEADAVGYEGTRYDALLDDFEPGMTTDVLAALFARLTSELIPLVDSLRGQSADDENVLEGDFPLDRQHVFADSIAAAIGFDFEGGRLDLAQHPFCTQIGPGDVRIGTRYYQDHVGRGIFACLHEVGHALYEQGLDRSQYGTPMGEAVSLGVHESQSRLWENLVGRSEGFWKHFYPQLKSTFHESLNDVSLDAFRRAVNRVEPHLIRVEADEVTYNLHIMIRFELERALLDGNLVAADVPGAWNELYAKYLGVTPEDDRTGCLQDIHWADGLIGYFPTYTLGNVFAAQIFAAAERAIGPLEDAFAEGNFLDLRRWLGENIHRHGMRYRSKEVIERVTGNAPDPSALIQNLSLRYRTIG
ncbi:MAG TPA: carboxypeptidase M32 [Gemmatimonadaceae bacterium]|nr:carboxypeptidase M32 [Gemmatimonadaceae bacterium]